MIRYNVCRHGVEVSNGSVSYGSVIRIKYNQGMEVPNAQSYVGKVYMALSPYV